MHKNVEATCRLEFRRCTEIHRANVDRHAQEAETNAMVFGKNIVNLFDVFFRDAFQNEA